MSPPQRPSYRGHLNTPLRHPSHLKLFHRNLYFNNYYHFIRCYYYYYYYYYFIHSLYLFLFIYKLLLFNIIIIHSLLFI